MARTTRADIARAMYVGTKRVFKRNLKKQPTEQWKSYMKVVPSDKKEETYDTIGNLKPAETKAEGAALNYGKIIEGHRTTIVNETIANGLQVTMEAKEDEKWGIIPEAKVNELIRTMITQREVRAAEVWDNVTTSVSADGVAYAAHNHPLIDKAGTYNDNLVEAVFDLDSYKSGVKKFNHWLNHQGEKFYTQADAILAHKDRQTEIAAMLESTLVPFEQSNTKNTVPSLTRIFSSYIDELQVHLLDTSIESAIVQRRKGMKTEYDYDKRSTFDFFFNVHERYKSGMINPGFGFVTITGEAAV